MRLPTRDRVALNLFAVAVGAFLGIAIIHCRDRKEARPQEKREAHHQRDASSSSFDDVLFWTVIYPIVITP